MALVKEDGSEVTGANTYVEIADCDTYHTTMGNSTWTGDDATKEAAIHRAMRWLENLEPQWMGARVTSTQALAWPRTGVTDSAGIIIETNEIPKHLTDALCEAALRELVEANSMNPDSSGGTVKRKKVKAGPVESETEYVGGDAPGTEHHVIYKMVRRYMAGGGMTQGFLVA